MGRQEAECSTAQKEETSDTTDALPQHGKLNAMAIIWQSMEKDDAEQFTNNVFLLLHFPAFDKFKCRELPLLCWCEAGSRNLGVPPFA